MFTIASKNTRNDFTFYQKYGLVDIFIGVRILFAGILIWLEMVWMAGILIPFLLPSFIPFWIALAILGGMIVFIGMLILIRFLQKNLIMKQ